MPTHVLILNAETALSRRVYNPTAHFAKHLTTLGVLFAEHHVAQPFDQHILDGATHLLITGSSASVAHNVQRPPWYNTATQFILAAMTHRKPVLGVCFGHQLLASVLGGPTSVQKACNPEVGWQEITVSTNDPLLGEEGKRFWAFNLHFDEVVTVPNTAVTIARSAVCAIHGFRMAGAPVWGIQAHPEINVATARQILRDTEPLFDEEKRPHIRSALDSEPRDSGYIQNILTYFLRQQGPT